MQLSSLVEDAAFVEQAPAVAISRERGAALRKALIFTGALTILGTFTGVHMWFLYRERMPIGWVEAILSGFALWYPWLLLGPAVFWLSRRFPFDPDRWGLALAVHLPAGVIFGMAHGAIRSVISPWVDIATSYTAWKLIWGQMLLTYLSYLGIVAVEQAWVNYRRFRDRELAASQLESKLAQAQLEVLRMQLHPHFLFNTLHAISTLIHRDPDAADEMVIQLSDLLRMTLDTIGVQEVRLAEELDFTRQYLAIQQMRFQERLKVVIDVPPETFDARVPNQVLQPIVENAIRHGLDGRPGSGTIEIRARGTNSMLQLTVRDDGPGLKVNGSPYPSDGIGLANTRARLQQLYGPLATLDLTNHSKGGTLVTLLIPQGKGAASKGPVGQGDVA